MTTKNRKVPRVLGLVPNSRGLGLAVFEGPATLLHYKMRFTRRATERKRRQEAEQEVRWHDPDCMIREQVTSNPKKYKKKRKRIEALAELAEGSGIRVARYSRTQIRGYFERFGARKKDELARVIAGEFHELRRFVPLDRRAWMTEDRRMGLFRAAALVLTHYHHAKNKKS